MFGVSYDDNARWYTTILLMTLKLLLNSGSQHQQNYLYKVLGVCILLDM